VSWEEHLLHRDTQHRERLAAAGGVALAVQAQHRLALCGVQEVLGCDPRRQALLDGHGAVVVVLVLLRDLLRVARVEQVALAGLHGLAQRHVLRRQQLLQLDVLRRRDLGLELPVALVMVAGGAVVGHELLQHGVSGCPSIV
jgi:hypothetical protein